MDEEIQITSSILLTIKKMLGIDEEYHPFDLDIIININSVFLQLNQLGVGPDDPFRITNAEATWQEFLGDTQLDFPGVETLVYLRVRLLFDPPTNSFLVEEMRKQIAELEWRLMEQKAYLYPTVDEEEPEPDEPENPDDPWQDDPEEKLKDHRLLNYRSSPDQHPIEAITGLEEKLGEIKKVDSITNIEIDEVITNG